ncbi:hypothetical protein GCM10027053_42830 [Intrasporangium mesophilum]
MGLGLKTAALEALSRVPMSAAVPDRHRWRMLRWLGWQGVAESWISAGCRFTGKDLHLAYCFLNREVFIEAEAPVRIGRNTLIGPRVTIITATHEIGGPDFRADRLTHLPVTIGDGCWIGAGATILAGVSVGEGCVVGAGAVVTRDADPHGLYAGVPARRVRDLDA